MRYPRLLLTFSLAALFISGVAAGYGIARQQVSDAPATTGADSVTTSDWMETATRALTRDLGLDAAETQLVREQLAPVAQNIVNDRDRAQFAMHLRLLEAHDRLAAQLPARAARLKASREKLRRLILRKFDHLTRENPSPLLSDTPL